MAKHCGQSTMAGHGTAFVCGQPEWGPESKLYQCDKCRTVDLERTSSAASDFEAACREWVLGCSCAPKDEPWKCEECTRAFHERILGLTRANDG